MSDLTPRENELLRLILEWHNEHNVDTPVKRQWIEKRMGVEKSSVSDLKARLINKGYLNKDRYNFALTDQAREYLTRPDRFLGVRAFTPFHLPLLGQVKAGRTKQDEIRVDLSNFGDKDSTTIPIPYLVPETNAFVLEVVGQSMEHEDIREGDYVVVQPYPSTHRPKQGDLIVAKYLPPANESDAEEMGRIFDDLLEGPTIKYYAEIASDERPIRLSWRRDVSRSPYTIATKFIDPIGRVVGVYRAFLRR
jgi:SOS-response transcriptional repressor LexA